MPNRAPSSPDHEPQAITTVPASIQSSPRRTAWTRPRLSRTSVSLASVLSSAPHSTAACVHACASFPLWRWWSPEKCTPPRRDGPSAGSASCSSVADNQRAGSPCSRRNSYSVRYLASSASLRTGHTTPTVWYSMSIPVACCRSSIRAGYNAWLACLSRYSGPPLARPLATARMPAAAADASWPGCCLSARIVVYSCCAKVCAMALPITPAPTTTTSASAMTRHCRHTRPKRKAAAVDGSIRVETWNATVQQCR